ncbi:alpha/beta fold hydrolase [Sphingobacterium puteale]|uniref:alpha/beta fold hydrolase n=1 Tax=Sphingobacterium puteale TaxID=2420510 RepID=UPI003D950C43
MKMFNWIKKIVVIIISFIALVLLAGFIFESWSRAKAEKIIPNGQFVELDRCRLHYLKKGTGGPTIVFESALCPEGHLQWYSIQQELSLHTTTVSYDRAGILWSERGENPKTGEKMAEELYLLLEKSNAPKPYILVGHSMGGMLVRIFVDKYSQDVAGAVLIDSQHPENEKYLSPGLYKLVNKGLPAEFLKFANAFGLARLMFKDMFPPSKQYQYQNSLMPALLYKSAAAVLEEQEQMAAIKSDAAKIISFGNIPLYVISATDTTRFDTLFKEKRLRAEMVTAWDNMQKNLLSLSTNSKHLRVAGSGHYITLDQPQVIVGAVKELILQLRDPSLVKDDR